MAIKKRAKGKGRKKRRLAKGKNEITISPTLRKTVLDRLAALQKQAEDIALKIEVVQTTLGEVDFFGS